MIMNTQTSISLPKMQFVRLQKAAFRYGLSADALIRNIVANAIRTLLVIPEETLDEYDNPKEILRALHSALRAQRQGTLLQAFLKSISRARQ